MSLVEVTRAPRRPRTAFTPQSGRALGGVEGRCIAELNGAGLVWSDPAHIRRTPLHVLDQIKRDR